MIGIIGAMKIEVDSIIELINNKDEKTISGIKFVHGYLKNKEVVAACCGIGKVFAAICAQTMIISYNVSKLINVGVAGTLSIKLNIGSIAISSAVVEHDMDTSPLGDPVGLISGINIIEIPADKEMIVAIENAVKKANIPYRVGVIASGDQFINSAEMKKNISERFNAIACEMEGAAIGQVCYVNDIPFCVIRAISDSADGKSHMDYVDFTKLATANSMKVINNLF